MKQIISFKKELPFKTKVSDITSISLEREIKVENEGIVTGVFHITGDYKMNEGSINKDNFSFDLPFDITLDPRYDMDTIKSDIEDFYYDVTNDDALKVNIDLYVEAEYLPESIKDDIEDDLDIESISNISHREMVDSADNEIEEVFDAELKEEEIIDEEFKTDMNAAITHERDGSDLFSNLDNSETYVTYYVYIVKEDDTVDKILTKYGITKEELEDYNDISDIKAGDKLIIPKCNEE